MDWPTVLAITNLIVLSAVLGVLLFRRGPEMRQGVSRSQLAQLERAVLTTAEIQAARATDLQGQLERQLGALAEQRVQASRESFELDAAARKEMQSVLNERLTGLDRAMEQVRQSLHAGLDRLRTENASELERIRTEVTERLEVSISKSLRDNSARMDQLTASATSEQEKLRLALRQEMEQIRTHNETQLEKMRHTVDEKLQGTLEKRLGDSFQLVSDRLEQVQRGLGEMQSLANDVGGLKRVLSNVKSRGTWGEVQLARQLEDSLAPSQYDVNVAIKPGANERVEYAIKLPGREDETPVYLPVDSKFPQEPYERLLQAQETGTGDHVVAAVKDLERALRVQAQLISDKYVKPPLSTDFAIMYLPTEGLFAEVLRIPGLASELQTKYRVMITGPTTLMSLLGSLQMGFKTLAIEQRSSEVWQVLAAAKDEFGKYGMVWEKLGRQLKTAQRTVDEAGRRTRAVERRLKGVETLELTPTDERNDTFDVTELSPSVVTEDSMEV